MTGEKAEMCDRIMGKVHTSKSCLRGVIALRLQAAFASSAFLCLSLTLGWFSASRVQKISER